MSAARIGILLLGMAVIIILGTWGWTEVANAVNDAGNVHPAVAALVVYGIGILVLIVGFLFPYAVLRIRNNDW